MRNGYRTLGYDFLRTIAIFMVIIIHSNVIYLETNKGAIGWLIIMEITAICLVAVPLFFMISGALLLDCDNIVSIHELFCERLLKQFLPFISWSLIYTVVRIIMGKLPLTINSFTKLLYEPAYYQFWFMYTLLSIYLLLPIIQIIAIHLNQKQMEYLLAIWFVFSVLIPGASYFINEFRISKHIDLILCEGYIGYFFLGFYLKKYKKTYDTSLGILLTIIGCLLTGVVAWIERVLCLKYQIKYQGYVYQAYLLPGVVVSVIGIFLVCQKMKLNQENVIGKIIVKLSKLSIGVFYVHMLFLALLEYIGFTGHNSMFVLTIKTILVYILSLITTCIITRIPILRSILLGMRERKR